MRTTLASSPLRWPERVELVYFFYLAILALFLHDRPRADSRVLILALSATLILWVFRWCEKHVHYTGFSVVRDWFTLALVLAAYRSLNWFSPDKYDLVFEHTWIRLDVLLLGDWHVRQMIEGWGFLPPAYLEGCYLLTSGAGCYALAILYIYRKRQRCDRFLLLYVLGTLLSYILIPFFPSEPPRVAFPNVEVPLANSAFRTFNLLVLSGAGIHAGVFPSAHVSSTFAAAWGMFRALPERPVFGWIFLVYAVSVAIATVYGRYHFAIDAVAGIAVSLVAVVVVRMLPSQDSAG